MISEENVRNKIEIATVYIMYEVTSISLLTKVNLQPNTMNSRLFSLF